MLRIMHENLMEILVFSFDLTEGFEASESKLGKMTYNHFEIQKLLKEQRVIKSLLHVLKTIDEDFILQNLQLIKNSESKISGVANVLKKHELGTKNGGKLEKKADTVVLFELVNVTFKILRNAAKCNQENCLLLFQNIGCITKFLGLDTFAENCLMEAFSSGAILEKLTAEHFQMIVEQYVKVLRVTNIQTESVFVLLKSLLRSRESTVGKNQLLLFELFFRANNPLLVAFESTSPRIYVNKVELNSFCDDCPPVAEVFGQQVKLCAELCLDRNYICSKKMKQWFPLECLLHYLVTKPIKNSVVK